MKSGFFSKINPWLNLLQNNNAPRTRTMVLPEVWNYLPLPRMMVTIGLWRSWRVKFVSNRISRGDNKSHHPHKKCICKFPPPKRLQSFILELPPLSLPKTIHHPPKSDFPQRKKEMKNPSGIKAEWTGDIRFMSSLGIVMEVLFLSIGNWTYDHQTPKQHICRARNCTYKLAINLSNIFVLSGCIGKLHLLL